MMNFLPPADSSAVYALIALITDPEAAKERLNALTAQSAAFIAASKEASEKLVAVETGTIALAESETRARACLNELAAAELKGAARQQELTAAEAALAGHKKDFDTHTHNARELLTSMHVDLEARTRAVEQCEKEAVELHERAEQLRADYEAKLAQLKAMVQ
jgi:chromosome segregation ATPase